MGLKPLKIAIFFNLLTIIIYSQDSLVGYWSFDELNNDTVYDESSYKNHGRNYGADLIHGVNGKALYFGDTTDYVRIPEDGKKPPSILSQLEEGTISLWFKVNKIPTDYGIAPILYYGSEEKCDFFDAANKGLIIEVGHSPIHLGSERLYFTIWKNGCTYPSFCFDSNKPIPTREWHHIVIVVGDNYNTGFFNGKEMEDRRYNFGNSSYSQFFADAIAHEKMWLGMGHWDRTTQSLDGAIDELKIFNKALNKEEIKEIHNEADPLFTSSQDINGKKSSLKVFPNPANNYFYYDTHKLDNKITALKITSLNGKTVWHKTGISKKGKINTDQFPPGLYQLHFLGEEISLYKKIIISR
jgi:hypothetical protein